jgi:hypothetical protein
MSCFEALMKFQICDICGRAETGFLIEWRDKTGRLFRANGNDEMMRNITQWEAAGCWDSEVKWNLRYLSGHASFGRAKELYNASYNARVAGESLQITPILRTGLTETHDTKHTSVHTRNTKLKTSFETSILMHFYFRLSIKI